ncbi:MAG: amidohydrolase family protein, partial [Candidatus Aminicenantes bacterium]
MTLKNVAAILAIIFIVSFAGACSQPYEGPPADFVIKNAKVVTIDKDNPRAQAVAVIDEFIIAVTSNKKIEQYIDEATTKVIDAKGRFVVPGFNDAHIHFLSGGSSMMNLDFRYIHDVQTIQKMVEEKVKESKPGELIRGGGWEHETFPDKKWPTKEILDAVAPNNPVMLSRADGHSVWVNSYVIKMSGITKDTPDPPNGTIVKDPVTGEPTGIFKEGAQGLLRARSSVRLTPEERDQRADKALELALEAARKTGVTSIQQLNGGYDQFQRFKDEGRLTLRVTFNM